MALVMEQTLDYQSPGSALPIYQDLDNSTSDFYGSPANTTNDVPFANFSDGSFSTSTNSEEQTPMFTAAGRCIDLSQPHSWSVDDVKQWMYDLAYFPQNLCYRINPENFDGVDGIMLTQMSREAFLERDGNSGDFLFSQIQQLVACSTDMFTPSQPNYTCSTDYEMASVEKFDSVRELLNLRKWYTFDSTDKFASLRLGDDPARAKMDNRIGTKLESEVKEEATETLHSPAPPASPAESDSNDSDNGGNSKAQSKKKGKLWEFVRDMLLSPEYNPRIIKWEDRSQGLFKIVKSDQVAKLWGERKCNPSMNYEKMSRALRHYYKRGVLEKTSGNSRLIYKFGPNSSGW